MTCIGFVPALDPHAGGVFQYSATMMSALANIARADGRLDLIALTPEGAELPEHFVRGGWRAVSAGAPVRPLRRVLRRLAGTQPVRWLRERAGVQREPGVAFRDPDTFTARAVPANWWRSQGIELMIYPQPQAIAFEAGIPYAIAVHDLQHRLQPEFGEVSGDGEWERREFILRNCCRHSTRILVDSEIGKEHVLFFYGSYGVSPDQVQVLPFLPSSGMPRTVAESARLDARRRYGIPGRYLIYPAQFWPHKNHLRIIEALESLNRLRGLRIPVVFCGARTGELRERHYRLVMNMAEMCGVADQVHVLGYVSDDDLAALYAGARALVMPTFFGPTNIPVIEAWTLGCPVLTSDISGAREQAGDAAVLVDPRLIESIAGGIERLWTDDALRDRLIEAGYRRLGLYTQSDYERRLRDVVASLRDALR